MGLRGGVVGLWGRGVCKDLRDGRGKVLISHGSRRWRRRRGLNSGRKDGLEVRRLETLLEAVVVVKRVAVGPRGWCLAPATKVSDDAGVGRARKAA